MQDRVVPMERFAAAQTEVAMLRKQNYESIAREKKLRQELDAALRKLAAQSKHTAPVRSSTADTLPSSSSSSSSSGMFAFPGILRRLKQKSQTPNLKHVRAGQRGDYTARSEDNAKIPATARQAQLAPECEAGRSTDETDEDQKMEELVRSFDITGGDRRPAPDLPTRRPRRASPRPVRLPHISRAGAGAPEVPKAPAARGAEQTRASPELDGTKAELARVMAKTASLQSEMDCVVADYCAAMDLMRDLKEYGEEKRRLADLAVKEKKDQSRAHEHACNQLRNAHHKTLTTVRSGLAAHITSLEAELQKAGARIRGLEAAVAASAAFRASSPSPSFTSSFSNSAQHPHRRSQFAGQVAASVSGPASAAAPTQRHHGAVAGSAGSMGEATTLFEEIAKEFESRVPKF